MESHTGPELVEKDKTIKFIRIPRTEEEKALNKPPNNSDLHPTLQSEAFNGYD